jgi:pyridoxamine 5'-phosphate oxidase
MELQPDPLVVLGTWIEEAREKGLTQPASVAFVTASSDGRPSARTVTLKRLERDSLIFTSALWTRKAKQIVDNPRVALLFHWPELGRQVEVQGSAAVADRTLAEELFAARDRSHQMQTIVSRQGESLAAEDLERMRDGLAHLDRVREAPPACPEDWGALRVTPETVELWSESPDRLHERRLFRRDDDRWSEELIAP